MSQETPEQVNQRLERERANQAASDSARMLADERAERKRRLAKLQATPATSKAEADDLARLAAQVAYDDAQQGKE